MQSAQVKTLVFSSSATNPCGRSKLHIEEMLNDVAVSAPNWRIACLPYFNPVGAHESGLSGRDPGESEQFDALCHQIAVGRREYLNFEGNDYATSVGTGVRDYIHVVDLAQGHLKAFEYLASPMCIEVNLGTGVGYSVLDVVKHLWSPATQVWHTGYRCVTRAMLRIIREMLV